VRNEKRDTWIQWLPGTVGTVLVAFVIGLLIVMDKLPLSILGTLLVGVLAGLCGAAAVLTWRSRRRQ
jgi:hypothetical protein